MGTRPNLELLVSGVACRQCFIPSFLLFLIGRHRRALRTGCTILIHFASVEFLHPVENFRLWAVSRFTPKSIIL